MAIISAYSGLNAKIKAMRGRLLKYDDYFRLVQLKTVEDVANKLREHSDYREVLAPLDDSGLHRAVIEQRILLTASDDLKRIYSFIDDHGLKVALDAFVLQGSINIIKQLLSEVYDHRKITYTISELDQLLGSRRNIDLKRLTASATVEEFIENLRGSIFYKMLTSRLDEHPTLFSLEMRLDLYYYMNLWEMRKKSLKGQNKRVLGTINGTEIDLRNIIWVFRLKTYYRLTEAQIYSYLIPYHYRLSKDKLAKMVEAKSMDELWNEIRSCPYGHAFDDVTGIERGFYKVMSKTYSTAIVQFPDTLALTFGYIYLKDLELKNIVSLLEGVRYGLKQEEILKYIIV